MDFKHIKTFLPPNPEQGKIPFKKETNQVPFSKKIEKKTKITCFWFAEEMQQLIAGTSDGKLYIWERRGLDHKVKIGSCNNIYLSGFNKWATI